MKLEVKDGTGTIVSVVETQYAPCACSPLGKVSQVAQPHAPADGARYTVYTYDASGRTLTIKAPDTVSITAYAYLGNVTKVTDPLGKWKQYTTDAMGNLVQVEEPNPADSDHNLKTTYTYDAFNHLTQVSMPRSTGTQTRSWEYDGNQRLTKVTTPESGAVTYVYNPDGTLQYKTDAKGQKTRYTYDEYGRRSLIEYLVAGSSTPDPCQTVTLLYDDPFISGFGSYLLGHLSAATWGDDTSCTYHFRELYSYSQAGLLIEKRLGIASGSTAYGYADASASYDLEGRMTSYCMSQDQNLTTNLDCYVYQRDALGRATGLTQGSSTPLVSGVSYGAAGQLLSMTQNYLGYGTDGYTENRTYNANLQLTRLTATPLSPSAQGIDLEYKYGALGSATNGRITEMVDHISDEDVTYLYDALNRLTSASAGSWGQRFQFDGFGNLTAQTATAGNPPQWTATIDAATNRRTDWSYDANGNATATPDGVFSYDVKNRVVSNGAIYDPSNRRVWDGNSLYLYGPNGKLFGVYVPTLASGSYTTRVKWNVWFEGKLIRQNNQWVMTDRLGSVRADAAGERFNYYPYGQEMTPTSDHRMKFATYWRDSAGVDYAEQRYFANGAGRFLTADPAGAAAGGLDSPDRWNRYGYVHGDPINYLDPHGRMEACPGGMHNNGANVCVPDNPGSPSNDVDMEAVNGNDDDQEKTTAGQGPVNCADAFLPTLQTADHQAVLSRVLNENTFGGADQLKEDEGIVSVLYNRANNPSLFHLRYGDSTNIDDQAKYAGSPNKRLYNYANLDALEERFANLAIGSQDCQKFLKDVQTAQDAIKQVLSGDKLNQDLFFWFTKGAKPRRRDGSVGDLIETWDNTSFYGIK